jgi:hypothetical protein
MKPVRIAIARHEKAKGRSRVFPFPCGRLTRSDSLGHALSTLAAASGLTALALLSRPCPAAEQDGSASLAERSAAMATDPQHWHGDSRPARGTVEIDTRPAAAGLTTLQNSSTLAASSSDPALVRVRYVGWTGGSRAAVGVSVGMANAAGPAFTSLQRPVFDPHNAPLVPELGLRLRTRVNAEHRLDVGAWRSYDTSANTPAAERQSYNARVELQFVDQKTTLATAQGALGLQMSGGSQVMLRSKKGGPMLYYRARF